MLAVLNRYRKSGQELFFKVVIAPTGVYAVGAFQVLQNRDGFFRILNSIVLIVEEVTGNSDKVHIIRIYFVHHGL